MRVAYFVSHPIQYQAPLLRRIAQERDIEFTVFFFSDMSVRGYSEAGFGGVQALNVDALSSALRRFLDDPPLARTMGKHATETIAAHSFQQDVESLRCALAFAVPEFGVR